MSPQTTTTESLPSTDDFTDYTWVKGKFAQYDSACIRARGTGQVYLGVKGFDRKSKRPAYVAIEMTAEGLDALIGAAQAARAGIPAASEE